MAQQHVRSSFGASAREHRLAIRHRRRQRALEFWLRQYGAYQAHTDELLLASACARLRSLRIELPAKGELERVVSAALTGFYQGRHRNIADGALAEARTRIDELRFEQLKSDPGKPGVDNLNVEIGKLQIIRAAGLNSDVFSGFHGRFFNS